MLSAFPAVASNFGLRSVEGFFPVVTKYKNRKFSQRDYQTFQVPALPTVSPTFLSEQAGTHSVQFRGLSYRTFFFPNSSSELKKETNQFSEGTQSFPTNKQTTIVGNAGVLPPTPGILHYFRKPVYAFFSWLNWFLPHRNW